MSLWLDFMGAEVKFVQTEDFGRFRTIEAGDKNKESLILMHGIGGHIEAYAKNVVALSEHFHVVAFDFLGHGLSDNPTDIEYFPSTYAEMLIALMNTMGIDKAHISGESLGGWVAGLFAYKYPERTLRVVLNTAGGIPVVSEQGKQDIRDLDTLNRKNFGKAPTTESVRERMQWLIHPNNWDSLLTDELIQSRLALYTRPEFQQSASLVFSLLKRQDEVEARGEMLPLEDLSAEILFFWTNANPIHDLEAATQACARTPNAQLYVMKADAAHWPQYECPAEFNEVVTQYLLTGKA